MIFYYQKLNEKAFESVMYFDLLYPIYIFFGKEKSWEIVVSSGEVGKNIFAQRYMFPPPV